MRQEQMRYKYNYDKQIIRHSLNVNVIDKSTNLVECFGRSLFSYNFLRFFFGERTIPPIGKN